MSREARTDTVKDWWPRRGMGQVYLDNPDRPPVKIPAWDAADWGEYSDNGYDPVGLLLSAGEVLSPPVYRRGSLLVSADGEVSPRITTEIMKTIRNNARKRSRLNGGALRNSTMPG